MERDIALGRVEPSSGRIGCRHGPAVPGDIGLFPVTGATSLTPGSVHRYGGPCVKLFIEPLDVMFFRDGKPFVAGQRPEPD